MGPWTSWLRRNRKERELDRELRSFLELAEDRAREQGAELVLDLVDRKGKYENGFMHGPVPAWREHGELRRARKERVRQRRLAGRSDPVPHRNGARHPDTA